MEAARIIHWISNFLMVLVLIRLYFTWTRVKKPRGWAAIVCTIVDPMLAIFRRFLPRLWGMDFSHIALILFIMLLQGILLRTVLSLL